MASLLPVIKNGGFKKILNWNHNWEQYVKYQAFQIHQSLMSGSKDDIDFIIKIIQCWDNQPSDELRQTWAEKNFINQETLESISIERNSLLDYFYQKSGEEARKINLGLLPKVRSILSYIFPEVTDFVKIDNYQYDQLSKPQDQSQINCRCLPTLPLNINWMSINEYPQESKDSLYLRLMIDQFYPLNSILFLTKTTEGNWQIKNPIYKSVKVVINLPKDQDFGLTESLEVKVIGYSFKEEPMIIVNIVNPPEPFDLFLEKYKIGDSVAVEVKEILRYPNDQNPVLITQEILTQALIFIDTNQLTFSNASSAINQIPLGSILKVQVEQIDTENRWIFISMYQTAEKLFDEKFTDKDKNGNEKSQIVLARVIKIEAGNIQLILDWSKPEIGFLPIITVFSDFLIPKKPEDYVLGEEILVSVYRNKKTTRVDYPNIPEHLNPKFEDNKKLFGLGYNNGFLEFEKRMSFNTKETLLSFESDTEFQQAIKKIYWLSNRIFVGSFLDIIWFKEVNINFPLNSIVKGIIQEIIPNSGLILTIDDVYRSFLPRSLVLNQFKSNLSYSFHVGDEVNCQIIEVQYDQKQFILKQVFFEKPKLTPIVSNLEPDIPKPVLTPTEILPVKQSEPLISIPQSISTLISETTAPEPTVIIPQPKPMPEISVSEPTKNGWGKFKKWFNDLTK